VIVVNSIKLTVPIAGDVLPRDVLPAEGAPGSAKATVELRIKGNPFPGGDGGELVAVLKAKTYREVLKKVDASPHGAWAVLQGKLGVGGVVHQAGFVVQPMKMESEAAPENQAPAETA
jgi:hypothetical protein